MNKKNIRCEECGTELIQFVEGSSCGLKCPKCNKYFSVTTYLNPAMEDEKVYSVILLKNEYSAKKVYSLVKVIHCGLERATQLLKEENIEIYCGKAIDILKIIAIFKESNINYVVPEFPYN